MSSTVDGMTKQNQIKRVLSEPETIEYVSRLLEEEEFFSRTELADFLCEEFGFRDPRGEKQRGGCLKGLRELEAKGWFQLPPPESQKRAPSRRRSPKPVTEP